MGSAIIAYSTLSKAKELFPNAELYFLVFRKNRESVDVLGIIPPERVIVVSDKSFVSFALSTISALFRMWRLKIDTSIDMELFSRCTALLSYLSGASNRVGYDQYTGEGLYRGNFLTHRVLYNPHQHMAINFLALLYSLCADPQQRPLIKRNLEAEQIPLPRFEGVEPEKRAVDELLRSRSVPADAKLVVVNPDPGLLPLRGWPLENFASVCRRLCDLDPRVTIVVVGLAQSKPIAQFVLRDVPEGRAIDLTGQTRTLRELVVLFNRCHLLITNDSGPAHFAALTPIHSIVLFGPETPRLYAPLSARARSISAELSCSPCFAATNHRRSVCNDNICMQAISEQKVLQYATQALAEGL